MSEYQIEDAGGIEMLTAACQQLDRAESLREQIDVTATSSGRKLVCAIIPA